MEFWIFYDKATGVEISSGSGTPQMFAAQPVPEGTGIIKVPYDFALRMPRPLDLLRAEFEAKIDGEADAFAQRFITPGIRKALKS